MDEQEFLFLFPEKIRGLFLENQRKVKDQEEIRLRIHQPVICLFQKKEEILSHKGGKIPLVTEGDLKEFLQNCSHQSLYAYEKEMRQGFLTLKGGHRVGMCGEMIWENGNVKNLKHVYFMNIRIAHTLYDCGKKLYPYLFEEGVLQNTLILSPPGYGKTTLLRDLIRLLSNGDKEHPGRKVGVIDERSEIAACYRGIPQIDIGMRTDVFDQSRKKEGMERMLRSMSPEVLAVDELSGRKEWEAVMDASYKGCVVFATAHGRNFKEFMASPECAYVMKRKLFTRIITIQRKENGTFMFLVQDHKGKILYTEH